MCCATSRTQPSSSPTTTLCCSSIVPLPSTRKALRPGGILLFECNTLYAADTAAMLRTMGFNDPAVHADCFGKPRFVEAVVT